MAKKLVFVDFAEQYDETKLITDSEGINKNEFTPNGIYSEEIFGDYYSDNDLTKKGWIKLNHSLISPILFTMMKKKKLITKDQNLSDVIKELKENPDIYLEERRNKKNSELVDYLFRVKDKIIINHFPVFSHSIRPITIMGGVKPTIIRDEINNKFSMLIEYNNQIEDVDDDLYFETDQYVKTMQESLCDICKIIIKKCSGKQGILRKELLGAKINNSSRCVITPYTGDINIDDCAMPYLAGVELLKYQIINLLTKIKGYNYNQALTKFELAKIRFDKEIYLIMCDLVNKTKGGIMILLNRNPTISVGSILELRVKEIKADLEDYTFNISNNILTPLAGDYDGDVLNIILLHDNKLKEAFKVLSPRNLIINKNGKFDDRFSFIKEQNLGIYNINNC